MVTQGFLACAFRSLNPIRFHLHPHLMQKVFLVTLLTLTPLIAADSGAMTDAERTYLLDQLEQSKKAMLATIQVSPAQWTYKSAPTVWSVEECAEHLILAEDFLMGAMQQTLKTPAADRLPTANPEADRKLVAAIKDRSKKATAPEPIVPAGKYATPADAAREFTARRDKTIAYVKTTNDELRAHSAAGPLGPMDGYQFLLLLAAHTARHTAQMQEVQSGSGYPKTTAAAR